MTLSPVLPRVDDGFAAIMFPNRVACRLQDCACSWHLSSPSPVPKSMILMPACRHPSCVFAPFPSLVFAGSPQAPTLRGRRYWWRPQPSSCGSD